MTQEDPRDTMHGSTWSDAEGNRDWDASAQEAMETKEGEALPARYDVIAASEGKDPWAEGREVTNRLTRRRDHPGLFALVDKYDLQTGDIDFSTNHTDDSGSGRDPLNTEKLIEERPAEQSNSFSSRIRRWVNFAGKPITEHIPADYRHLPIFDIDHPVLAWETTTPGHYHLVIDRPMSEQQYLGLLHAMVKAGIVQEGYSRAAHKRRAGWLRMPWTKKEIF